MAARDARDVVRDIVTYLLGMVVEFIKYGLISILLITF